MTEVTYFFNSKSTSVWTDSANMIDNILTNYATTAVTGAAEVLDGNTCPGDDLGPILKVELRAYGYGDGDDRIDLTPVFGGVDDGDTHETVPTVDPDWGAPQDITTDTNNPSPWSWSDVQNLDCKVKYTKDGKANTMYCAKVEVIVTLAEEGGYIGSWELTALNAEPVGITTDGTNIWVVDWTTDDVYKYDMAGDYIDSWSLTALNASPRGITTDGTNIWVVDWTTDDVYKYNMVGGYIDSWSLTGENTTPSGITTDGTNIWVVDLSDDVVYKYNMTGGYVDSWSLTALNASPHGIATDGTNIWVDDTGTDDVYKYLGPVAPPPPAVLRPTAAVGNPYMF